MSIEAITSPVGKRAQRDYVSLALMPDEEVAQLAQEGHPGAAERLVRQFRGSVEQIANRFFLLGADKEDVVQEGMIGLSKAIRDFRSDQPTTFQAFADLCIRRQIQTAVRAAGRHKHRALNLALPEIVACRIPGDAGPLHEESCSSRCPSSFSDDLLSLFPEVKQRLTNFENAVLEGYLLGHTYSEMGVRLGRPCKAIDNGLQRAKRKIIDLFAD